MTSADTAPDQGAAPGHTVAQPYDGRRLSYAGTFTNPWKSGTIRTIEWLTAKPRLLSLIRRFERKGAPTGADFWPQALEIMGIDVQTPMAEIARIPARGPVVVVANHPHGLVDGMVLAWLIGKIRDDYKILTRSLLTGVPEIAKYMLPVPFPHEANALEDSLAMRAACMAHLKDGGCVVLFPAGRVAHSAGWWGQAVEGDWNPFTAKMVMRSGATVVPIRFSGQNTRAYQIAANTSATLRQSLLLYEIKAALNRPQRPIVGHPVLPQETQAWARDPRGYLAWLRERTLALTPDAG